jgi:hypothetical protein
VTPGTAAEEKMAPVYQFDPTRLPTATSSPVCSATRFKEAEAVLLADPHNRAF